MIKPFYMTDKEQIKTLMIVVDDVSVFYCSLLHSAYKVIGTNNTFTINIQYLKVISWSFTIINKFMMVSK